MNHLYEYRDKTLRNYGNFLLSFHSINVVWERDPLQSCTSTPLCSRLIYAVSRDPTMGSSHQSPTCTTHGPLKPKMALPSSSSFGAGSTRRDAPPQEVARVVADTGLQRIAQEASDARSERVAGTGLRRISRATSRLHVRMLLGAMPLFFMIVAPSRTRTA